MNLELREFLRTTIPPYIAEFHARRYEKLGKIKLTTLLEKKNPYLYKAKNISSGTELVRSLLDAYLISQEETLFGTILENIAIAVTAFVHNGYKSGIEGIDLEFSKDEIRYIVSIKSGPNWGNSGQQKKMIDHFNAARRILRTSNSNVHVKAINGCCYGRSTPKNTYQEKGDYEKLCGQAFWSLISNDETLYIELIEPIGIEARSRNEEFMVKYDNITNLLAKEALNEFCLDDGSLNWPAIIEFNIK